MMIDTHCHLSIDDYSDLNEVIAKMGNNIMITSGSTHLKNKELLELCHNYSNIYGTLGIHPNEINDDITLALDFIDKNLDDPKIVGIGEIGLDYHWHPETKEIQKIIFIKQIELAKKHNKTIVIHSRDSLADVVQILKDNHYQGMKVVMHCYSGDLEMARQLTNLGIKLGIGGVVTFKNAKMLQEVVKNIDIKYLLLETDSPYLTPEPMRGEKNEPANILLIAQKIAEIKGITTEEVLLKTPENAISQFDLKC